MFWKDRQLDEGTLPAKYPQFFVLACDRWALVFDYLLLQGGVICWDTKFRRVFKEKEAENFLLLLQELYSANLQLNLDVCDEVRWEYKSGKFSIRSFYDIIEGNILPSADWGHIWKVKAPPKIKPVMWLNIKELCPKCLCKLCSDGGVVCTFCNLEEETVDCLFWKCPFAQQVWDASAEITSISLRFCFMADIFQCFQSLSRSAGS